MQMLQQIKAEEEKLKKEVEAEYQLSRKRDSLNLKS